MFDSESPETLIANAECRSNIYGFLSRVYRQELTSDFLRQIKTPDSRDVWVEIGIEPEADFVNMQESDIIEYLAVEYARLFLGPGQHISPHESVHKESVRGGGMLCGKASTDVKEFIESRGIVFKSDYTGFPDHISVELEFMHHLILWEKKSLQELDGRTAEHFRAMEQQFLNDHIKQWIPLFCEKVIKKSNSSFYKGMAQLTKRFIELEPEDGACCTRK